MYVGEKKIIGQEWADTIRSVLHTPVPKNVLGSHISINLYCVGGDMGG